MKLANISHLFIMGPKSSQTQYIKKYPNSLVASHFKETMQLGTFAFTDLGIDADLCNL